MFVVTVETDEAPSFCAFTRSQPALDWALSRSLEDSGCVVGVYRAPGGSSGVRRSKRCATAAGAWSCPATICGYSTFARDPA